MAITRHSSFSEIQSKNSLLCSVIDAVLVINLDSNIERWQTLRDQINEIIPDEIVHRISAVPGAKILGYGERPWFRGGWRAGVWANRGGCVLSHRKALEMARDRGWERVLILEDDAVFSSDFLQHFRELVLSIADLSINWDVIYLGYTEAKGPYKTQLNLQDGRHLTQIFGCLCTHAYIVNRRIINWSLPKLPNESSIWRWLAFHRAIDRWYNAHFGVKFDILAVSPPLINQRVGFSDILGRFSSHACGMHNPQCLPIKENPYFYALFYFARIVITNLAHAHNFLSACRKFFMGF